AGTGGGVVGAGRQHYQVKRIAAVERQLGHGAAVDRRADLGRRRLDQRGPRSNLDRLADRSDFQLQLKVDGMASEKVDPLLEQLEPGLGCVDFVSPDRELRKAKDSFPVGDGFLAN